MSGKKNTKLATLASGSFWCTEAVFQDLEGVESVQSGYSGGYVENPTYEEVCDRTTGHAQCVQIEYDPEGISYDEILELFWAAHDPTTLNRQGNDVGPQFRSVVFYHDEEQKTIASMYKKRLNESGVFRSPIVTAIEPIINFYPAEDFHKNYYLKNPAKSYCYYVIKPKLEKLKEIFSHKLNVVA